MRGYTAPAAAPYADRVASPSARLGWVDIALVCLFIIGLYTHYTIQISARVPFPSAPAGVAGMILLWRRRDQITPAAFCGFVGIVLLYMLSILCATDISWLGRRFNGLLQLTYSLTIGFALFLTIAAADRRQIARLFLGFALVILIGCLAETYAGFRPVSDKVRLILYSAGIYENDLRDIALYGRVRPKFFASEPASVTFTYSIICFVWLVVSTWRWKLFGYLALVGLGLVAMPGPTLLLMLLLILPYELFIAGRKPGQGMPFAQLVKVAVFTAFFGALFVGVATSLFSERLRDLTQGNDASFFYRVRGPTLAAMHVMRTYPIAGAGLTGEPFVEQEVVTVYAQSPFFSVSWQVVTPSTELLINYFWLHWIYLGAVWGVLMMTAISLWLRVLGVPSALFCWMVWAVLGQASGAYVGPMTWAVLHMAGAAALLHTRQATAETPAPWPVPLRHRVRPRPEAPSAASS